MVIPNLSLQRHCENPIIVGFFNGHLVKGQGPRLIGTDNLGPTCLNGRQGPEPEPTVSHSLGPDERIFVEMAGKPFRMQLQP